MSCLNFLLLCSNYRGKLVKILACMYSESLPVSTIFFLFPGDDGKMENENPGLIKESEHMYTLWCSGRLCCEGMLVELKLLKVLLLSCQIFFSFN